MGKINKGVFYTIGEVAELAGIPASALRYYERIGLLPPATRLSGQRRYTTAILPLLAIIQMAKDAKFSLPEIQELLQAQSDGTGVSERWRTLATAKIAELDAAIVHAQEMKSLLEESLICGALQFELKQAVEQNAL